VDGEVESVLGDWFLDVSCWPLAVSYSIPEKSWEFRYLIADLVLYKSQIIGN